MDESLKYICASSHRWTWIWWTTLDGAKTAEFWHRRFSERKICNKYI